MEKRRFIIKWTLVISLVVVATLLILFVNSVMSRKNTPKAEKEKSLKIMAEYKNSAANKVLIDIAECFSSEDGNPHVEVEFVSPNTMKNRICLDKDNEELADIIICEGVAMPAYISMHVFADISDHMATNELSDCFYNELLYNTHANGKTYGMPLMLDPTVVIFNSKYYKDKGIELPSSIRELMECCEQTAYYDYAGIGFPARDAAESSLMFLQSFYLCGGSIFEMDSKCGTDLMEFIYRLGNNGMITKESINYSGHDLVTMFVNGENEMIFNDLSSGALLNETDTDFEYSVRMLPLSNEGRYLARTDNIGITVNADAEEALKFLDYISDKDIIEWLASDTCTIPVRKDVTYSSVDSKFQLTDEEVNNYLRHLVSFPSYRRWFDIEDVIAEGLFDTITGERDAATVISEVQDVVRTAIVEN